LFAGINKFILIKTKRPFFDVLIKGKFHIEIGLTKINFAQHYIRLIENKKDKIIISLILSIKS